MSEYCWGFHVQAIPEASLVIVDMSETLWHRAGIRLWRDGKTIKHESWLLREHGPVRCPVELEVGLPLTIRSRPA